ncbi:hypothetical protein BXY51_004372 [Actinoplanes cyaneus]|nr:hypothetical protein [Actinoplanes cyaneus]
MPPGGDCFGACRRLCQHFPGWNNVMVAQMSLFSRTELAGMRDRTLARNYSAEAEEFRRVHERHRAWGLRQRHARKLVRSGWGASAAWAAVTAGQDQRLEAASTVAVPARPADPVPGAVAPVVASSAGRACGETPASPRQVSGRSAPASPELVPGRGRAGLFIVLVGWCVMVVKVALDKVGCRRVCRSHWAGVQVRATISCSLCWGRKALGARDPPSFLRRLIESFIGTISRRGSPGPGASVGDSARTSTSECRRLPGAASEPRGLHRQRSKGRP